MSVNIRTQFMEHARVYSNPGSPVKILYGPQFDENGVMELVEVGRENLYEYIQSHKESCDIQIILERCARGDTSALMKRQAMFGDFTEMPKTYAEALNALVGAESYFNSLPVETRAKFDHNFHKFLVSMNKPEFVTLMGFEPNSSSTTKYSEPNNDSLPPKTTVPSEGDA